MQEPAVALAAVALAFGALGAVAAPLTFEVVQKAHPKDIRTPWKLMTEGQLTSELERSLNETSVRTSGCEIQWQWRGGPDPQGKFHLLTVHVDSRQVRLGGGEVHQGRLLYHPESEGDQFAVVDEDGKVLLKQSWHTLEVKDGTPEAYWRVVGAFATLVERVSSSCMTKGGT